LQHVIARITAQKFVILGAHQGIITSATFDSFTGVVTIVTIYKQAGHQQGQRKSKYHHRYISSWKLEQINESGFCGSIRGQQLSPGQKQCPICAIFHARLFFNALSWVKQFGGYLWFVRPKAPSFNHNFAAWAENQPQKRIAPQQSGAKGFVKSPRLGRLDQRFSMST
jgi:hypothetical protein